MHKSLFSHFFETECGGHSNEVPEGLALIKQHVNCQIYSKKSASFVISSKKMGGGQLLSVCTFILYKLVFWRSF